MWALTPETRRATVRRNSNADQIKIVIDVTISYARFASDPRKCLKTSRYDACSMGGRERPEYLRQGAVSCWGAGSPAKSEGIVMVAMPFSYADREQRDAGFTDVRGSKSLTTRIHTAAPSGYCSANRSSFASRSTVVPDRFHAPSVSNRKSPILRPHGAMTRPIARKSVRSACS